MPRSLVTGGAGFLGSHLCERLLVAGHAVICIDNMITGKISNVHHLTERPGFTFVEADARHPLKVQGHIDHVFHLASLASPKDYAKLPVETLEAGSTGTANALEIAKASGSTFLFTSSSEVYGDPLVHPQSESYWGNVNPNGPRSMYDESKRYGEALSMAYHRMHGISVRIARIFNTYGPRMRIGDGRVIPSFMAQAIAGRPLTVYGNGSQTRSLCYVEDTIEGLFLLGTQTFSKGMPSTNLVMNIGNPQELTMLELARKVIAITNSKSTITYEALPEDDPRKRCPDISRAKAHLGWAPLVSLEAGLQAVMPYFKSAIVAEARRP